jgi:LmbE family N-acetylglucosaminyl deacetylase
MEMEEGKKALAFMAHPDDAEFLCAGTLALLHKMGYEIYIATMTAGDGGSMELPPEEIARIRIGEAERSAKILQGEYICAGMKDFFVIVSEENIKRATEILRRVRPSIVFAHHPADYMLDHESASILVRHACFCAGAPNMKTDAVPAASPIDGIPYLYYCMPVDAMDHFGRPVEMGFYVDIGDVIGIKEEMLRCHESQREWLLKHHGIDEYVERMKRWAEEAGRKAGVRFAEPFLQHRGHAYPRDNKLKEVLGPLVKEGSF